MFKLKKNFFLKQPDLAFKELIIQIILLHINELHPDSLYTFLGALT